MGKFGDIVINGGRWTWKHRKEIGTALVGILYAGKELDEMTGGGVKRLGAKSWYKVTGIKTKVYREMEAEDAAEAKEKGAPKPGADVNRVNVGGAPSEPLKPANDPNAPRPANEPGKVRLADDWIHSHDRVMMLAPKKCGKTTLTMTIAYDLCQGRAPRVLGLDEEIPRQYVIYYQFDLDKDQLNENYPSTKKYFEWLEILCTSGFEAKALFDDAKVRIEKRMHRMVTLIVDNLDKISSGKETGTWRSDEAFLKNLDDFRDEMKRKGYQVTTIVLNHAVYKKQQQAPVWEPVTDVYMRGSQAASNRVDVLVSLGPTREGRSVLVMRDCLNRHREAWAGEKVAILRRVRETDLQCVFERWDEEKNVLPLKPNHRTSAKPENRTLQQKQEDEEKGKRGRNIDWTDDMLLRAAEIIEVQYTEAEQAGTQVSLRELAKMLKEEFGFENFAPTQVERLIKRLKSEGLLESSETLIVEMKERSA